MEHAVPEQFWIDRSQCRYVDENGQTKNPTLSDCGQAVSTVKALAIAQQQGQKIYTITPQNASTALAKLPVGGSVGQEIRNAVQAGKEVTIHEKSVSAYGWTGYGGAMNTTAFAKEHGLSVAIAALVLSVVAILASTSVLITVLSFVSLALDILVLWDSLYELGTRCAEAFFTLFGGLTGVIVLLSLLANWTFSVALPMLLLSVFALSIASFFLSYFDQEIIGLIERTNLCKRGGV
jgi:hypothetical protein